MPSTGDNAGQKEKSLIEKKPSNNIVLQIGDQDFPPRTERVPVLAEEDAESRPDLGKVRGQAQRGTNRSQGVPPRPG